ncbi:hypothetical protein O181_112667 [Austropuccinia psidii MF-1]|uniref:Uncharacterized protein n=1 Tax=Austropuccinia psidii MF-1 TaxID=1389203 RepID=A0A9Q3K292_9BASI|nr:hypothetical protein [Austropuccinia psidii MF-1]
MKEIHGRRSWPWWKSEIIQKYSNGTRIWQRTMSFENDKYSVDKDPYEWFLRQSKRLKCIDPQMNIHMRNYKLLTQIPGELEQAVKCRCNQNCTLDDIANTLQDVRKRTNIGKYSPYKSSSFKEKEPLRVELKDKTRERVAKRRKSIPLRKPKRRNPPQRILNQTLWVMPSENNLMMTKTQEKNVSWNTKRKHH